MLRGSRTIIDSAPPRRRRPDLTPRRRWGHVIWTPAYHTPILMDWFIRKRRGLPATRPPLLTISGPTGESNLCFADSALDLSGRRMMARRTNERNLGQLSHQRSPVLSAPPTGTTNWSITNLTLSRPTPMCRREGQRNELVHVS